VLQRLRNGSSGLIVGAKGRTVEYHLYKVYPELNISSRSELIRRYAATTGTATSGSTDSGTAALRTS
jgi:DNA-binding CsgD family transcriptional regulator